MKTQFYKMDTIEIQKQLVSHNLISGIIDANSDWNGNPFIGPVRPKSQNNTESANSENLELPIGSQNSLKDTKNVLAHRLCSCEIRDILSWGCRCGGK